MSAQFSIFVILVILVVGWFALGTHINVRKGHDAMRWLQSGLPAIGEKTTLRWLGSSVLQLQIEKAHPPFRRAEVLVVLEPRDVPPLWLLSRLQGRRDMLIVRAELQTLPRMRFELLDRNGWGTKRVEGEVKQQGWQPIPMSNPTLSLFAPQPVPNVSELLAVAQAQVPLVRLGVREQNNAVEIQWRLPSNDVSARSVFESVQRIARSV